MRPGSWLVESVIAEQMQISRGPVREAVKRLQQEGLVAEIPRRGKQVALLTESDVRELHVLRAMLEGHAVRLLCAASRRGPAMVRLRKTLARMRTAVLAGDMAQFSQMDFEFHREIMASAGMPRLFQVWSSLNGLLLIWLLTVQDAVRQLLREVLNDHLQVVQAIRMGDESLAKRLLRDHIVDRGEQTLHGSREIAVETPRTVPPRRRTKRQ
jgi:DNA-binding GntR family transcriptional regulator